MKLYIHIMKGRWAQYAVYRMNFIMWRLRNVMQILVLYFLWSAIFAEKSNVLGYSSTLMLTYILGINITRTLILGTRTMDIGDIINNGDLSTFLVRPLNFFRYYFVSDVADKVLNLVFASIELIVLYFLLRPQVLLQGNPLTLFFTSIALAVGVILYFYMSVLLGFIGFWSADVWAPRFLSFVLIEFFAGGLFPLDILPQPVSMVIQSLPFSYLLYFPLKIYLGQIPTFSIVQGLVVGIFWLWIFWYAAQLVWRKGLKVYAAEGR